MKQNFLNNKIIFLLIMLMYFTGCTTKVAMSTWVPPQNTGQNIAAKADYLIIVNSHKGELLYDIMEDALRERFTELPFLTVEGSFSPVELSGQLKDFNLRPRIEMQDRVAFLRYEVKENSEVLRSQSVRLVTLRRCNYLLEKNQCAVIGTATLREGLQKVNYVQSVSLSLKDTDGNQIVPDQSFERGYSISMKMVPDEIVLRKKVSNLIAREYTKQILPYRESFDIVLLDGDSIALEMIEKGAYSFAFKRLEKLITRDAGTEKTAENLYLQGVSLEFQSDMTGASSFYNEALLLDPGNEIILEAVNRIKKASLVSKKSV